MGDYTGRRRFAAAALAFSLSTALAGVPTLVHAQDTATVEQVGVGDIVVTAQRREENLQDVPISVTAINNDTLQAVGVGGTTTISQVVPSVQVTSSGPSNIFFVRGVGNTSGNVGEEGANAFYIDGVYLGDLTSAGTKFNNIQRIEVLKGPQGTLFGRNSSGGLINIITREPGDEATFQGKVGYGNYNTVQGQLYAATPLGDKVSIDVALTGKDQHDGFGTNLATGKDIGKGWYWGARSKLVFRPGDATKIVLSGDYYKDHNDYVNGFYLFKGSVGSGGYRYPGDYNLNTLDNGYAHIQTFGGSLTIEHEFDFATLTSITARRGVKVKSGFDADYTPTRLVNAFVPSRVNTFQQELRLASASTRPFNWQFGVFYYHAKANVDGFTLTGQAFDPQRVRLDIGTSTRAEMKTDSYAVFGEAGYDITDTTHLIAGIRYTKDERTYRGTVTALPTNVVTVAPPGQKLSTGKVTYRVALRQDLTDKVNVYASYNRGFKSGIFAATGSPLDPPVQPQTIDAFEIGLKSQLFDNLVRFNLAGFHYNIDDYQIRAQPSPGRTLLQNATSVKVDGVEGELTIAPSEGLTFNFVGTYLNSRFGAFPFSQFTYQSPATCNARGSKPAGQSTGPATGGGINCFGDASGNKTPLSPTFASSVSMAYRHDLGNDAEVIFNALWNHSSKIYFEADNRLAQPAYDVVNVSFELRPNKNWGIEFWGNNMLDKHYYQTGVGGTTGDHGELAPPRTYGVNLKFDF